MSYTSPFLDPSHYVDNLSSLSKDAITTDNWVASTVRQAKGFSDQHSSNFALIAEIKTSLEQIEPRWTRSLKDSRNAASVMTSWMNRYDRIFLAMINDVQSEKDAQDVVSEFQDFQGEGHPTDQYQLDDTPGPKKAFNEIEQAADTETKHIIEALQDSKGWQESLEELKQNLPQVQSGVRQTMAGLREYAIRLQEALR